jgi:KUP system potassium uptake protein
MTWIFYLRGKKHLAFISFLVTLADIAYLLSNSYKIPHGGYWSIVIGVIPFSIILLYTRGQRKLYKHLKAIPLNAFLERYNLAYKARTKLQGTALFFLKDPEEIPLFMIRSMFINNILYENNILVTIIKRDDPFGVTGFFREEFGNGLRVFEIQCGYMEIPDIEEILKEAGIEENTIFYGLEDIVTDNPVWKIFSIIKRLNPTFVQFYKLPSHKLHGVMTRVEI